MQIFINYIINYIFLAFGLFMYVFFNINITETITKKKKQNECCNSSPLRSFQKTLYQNRVTFFITLGVSGHAARCWCCKGRMCLAFRWTRSKDVDQKCLSQPSIILQASHLTKFQSTGLAAMYDAGSWNAARGLGSYPTSVPRTLSPCLSEFPVR